MSTNTIKLHRVLRAPGVFEDPNMPGEMVTTIDLTKVLVGTDVRIE